MTPISGTEWAPTLILAGFCLTILPSLPRQIKWARILAIFVSLSVTVRYLDWRLMQTVLPTDPLSTAGVWIWIVFLFELAALANASITNLMLTRTTDRSGEADRHEWRLRRLTGSRLPRVDIFICTYNEGLEVLEGPIISAKGMQYPNFTVWVLDDGRRSWLRDFC
jgi:cellulose synthase (UDP-forming)